MQYFIIMALLAACGQGPVKASYSPILPDLPPAWQEILGPPHWRLEWLNSDGLWAYWEGKGGFPDLSLMDEWSSPVLAWPFWPEKGLYPGQMSPAGALFPWDVSGKSLVLSWKAGIDAFFWRELADNREAQKSGATARLPWYFDWPRFRELMESENVPPEICHDPWLADWKDIALRTVESGFDRRRIKAEARTTLTISPCPANLWAGYSAFAYPVEAPANEPFTLKVREKPETWVSESGLLRCQKDAWLFLPW